MSLKHTKRKYCGKLLVKKVANITNDCFEEAIREVYTETIALMANDPANDLTYDSYEINDFKTDMRNYRYHFMNPDAQALIDAKNKVDELYLNKLLTLSTKVIEDVLWVHHNKKIVRAERTVETLTSELLRRELFNDTHETDPNFNKNRGSKPKRRRKYGSKVQ